MTSGLAPAIPAICDYRRMGRILGPEASSVALNLDALPRRERYAGVLQSGAPIALYEDEPQEPETPVLRVTRRSVALPLRKFRPLDVLEAEARKCTAELMRLRQGGSVEEVRSATARSTQANWQADMGRSYAGKTTVDWELQCIRVGALAFLSCQGEPFFETFLTHRQGFSISAYAVFRVFQRRFWLSPHPAGVRRGRI